MENPLEPPIASQFKAVELMRDIFPHLLFKTQKRANNCRVYKIKYKHRSKTRVILMVRCFEDYSNPKGHLVSLALEIPKEQREKVLASKRVAILTIPMKIFCTCPAYKFWGSHYLATKKAYNINTHGRETRPAKVRDPKGKNIACKHIGAVAMALKSQSVYKALVGKSKQSTILEDDNLITEHLENLEEMSVNECVNILEQQGLKVEGDVTYENFEQVMSSYLSNLSESYSHE